MTETVSPYAIQQAISTWESLRARLLSEDPELADDEASLVRLLEADTEDLTAIKARIIEAILWSEAMSEAGKTLADSMLVRSARYANRSKQYRGALLAILDCTGERKIETPLGTVSVRQSPAAVVVTDEASIPLQYWRVETKRSLDKVAIKEALLAGEDVDGTLLTNGMPTLALRVR